LTSSPNPDIKSLWVDTSYGTNLQYDQVQNTKQALKAVQYEHKDRIKKHKISQLHSSNSKKSLQMVHVSIVSMLIQPSIRIQHMISSCKCYLEEGRYTWRHNSVLLYLANTFSTLSQCKVYADLPSFTSPCWTTGGSFCPDLLLLTGNNVT